MPPETLVELEARDDFVSRHIGPTDDDVAHMLKTLNLCSIAELIDKTVPDTIRDREPLTIGSSKTERGTLDYLHHMASRNKVFTSMIGMGYYGTRTPSVILRNVLEHAGWYTAYTPYQAEISQGRMEALMNFQQMVVDLTGMELANASLLDEGTAAAEAMAMAKRVSKSKSNRFFINEDIHPQTLAVLRMRAKAFGFELIVDDASKNFPESDIFGAIIQYPGSSGVVDDLERIIKKIQSLDALAIVASDLAALCLIIPPGEMNADIVIGSAQRFGVPMGYGGPHAAFFATREQFRRHIPGRIIGYSIDNQGRPALRLALQTREQHIRREKATSNICTSQALLAIMAGFYAVYHGPKRLRKIAKKIHRMGVIVANGLNKLGFDIVHKSFFDTITVYVPGQADRIAARAREQMINLRIVDSDHLSISVDETTRRSNIVTLWRIFAAKEPSSLNIDDLDFEAAENIPHNLLRTTNYLEHQIFHRYHSETEMMRYMRKLVAKDIALNRAMIPLGSCTMKLNPASSMIPITWREFAHIHPFAPLEQTQGYQQLFRELEEMLCEATGFDAVSLQPNAGSQGEYSGLLTIRKYHESNGQPERDICLIPSSAHGTNPASAVMAGLKVIVIECDDNGNIDIEDLKAKVSQHTKMLAALMVTYPSTHGVFEEAIVDICKIMHDNGAQVYMDGANMNALVGIAKPGKFGPDVAHLNLHKTFSIPHGGGGPGVGPICVKKHLAPFLPDHPLIKGLNPAAKGHETIGAVASAPWGSASILPVSWSYMFMMKGHGLRRATEIAILNANYIAKRLNPYYPVLYTGRDGFVAHECIIDLRPIKETSGISNEDVAKRLIDYGFHAPTMSFPVSGTLMIEPTESESLYEIDRLCNALIKIREEISCIECGSADPKNNVLKNAPHSHRMLFDIEWDNPYSRELAFFPIAELHEDKYWPPVARIDNVYGDRHLACTCAPIEVYSETKTEN
ncbi:MAG: glycine dehydrogenase (aminomethyl-transferring) [Magnetovibrio sp.]|nr:glycine dehydrogenase (aminomethyl-transferring) [Magnetovibrio sp.]